MNVNTYQIGGSHYNSKNYQHWDFCYDANLPYVQACACKYVSRWRSKNGIEDLQKCLHYVEKAKSLKSKLPLQTRDLSLINRLRFKWSQKYRDHLNDHVMGLVYVYTSQFDRLDAEIMTYIIYSDFNIAIYELKKLIKNQMEK